MYVRWEKHARIRRNLSDFARSELVQHGKAAAEKRARLRMSEAAKAQKQGVEMFPHPESGKTRDELGELAGVSGRTLSKVESVLNHAPEPVKQDARKGDQRWGLTRRRAYELIAASSVVANLSEISDKNAPLREAHAAPLVELEPEAQRLAWEVVKSVTNVTLTCWHSTGQKALPR